LLFALVWSLGLASLFNLPQIGFSPAIGGFVAGLALANTGVHHQISGRIKSLRDFFIIIFFIVLGSELVLSGIGAAIVPALILSAFVLIGNPIIVMIILGLMGYKPRVSFMAGVTVAQISEFSLILIALGLAKNHVSEIHVTIVTLVGIITIGVSSLAITYSEKLYKFFHPILWIFDFHKASTNQILLENPPKNHILIIGVHRLGSHILGSLDKNQPTVLIDFNPDIAHYYKREGYNSICGDITDPSIQELVNIQHSKLIISTLPELQDNLGLLEISKKSKKRIQTIVAATDELDANVLYEAGADYVLLPHFIGGLHLAEIIHKNHNLSSLKKLKKQHLHSLKKLTHFH
jgi:voltage-gated potassium channel Kch